VTQNNCKANGLLLAEVFRNQLRSDMAALERKQFIESFVDAELTLRYRIVAHGGLDRREGRCPSVTPRVHTLLTPE
jgi:hypothetical protein